MTQSRARVRRLVAAVVCAVVCTNAAQVAAQSPTTDDPALEQRIGEEQPIASGPVVLSEGHVDVGPTVDDGQWRLMVHDDTGATSVWRDPAETVLRIGDAALVDVPDDPAYGFLGASPGDAVHVVSQTQQPGVVWVGWNTQHPAVMELIDRGVTLSLLGVEGPGQLSVYLQSGDFGGPEVLWSSAEDDPQSFWVDVNTHTHANWVFTEPGVYLVRIRAAAELRDGTTEQATADLRFAVGDGTDPDEALAAEPPPMQVPGGSVGDAAPPDSADGDDGSSGAGALLLVGAGAAVLLLVGGVVAWRGRRTRAAAARRAGGDS
jgi:putative ABC transporter-associated repeat protein